MFVAIASIIDLFLLSAKKRIAGFSRSRAKNQYALTFGVHFGYGK